MYEQKELTGKLLGSEIVKLILNLREIKEKHTIGTSNINYLGKTYDAQIVSHTLIALETVAKQNNLEVKELTAESSLDELLGIGEAEEIEVTTTLKCWNLLERIVKENI